MHMLSHSKVEQDYCMIVYLYTHICKLYNSIAFQLGNTELGIDKSIYPSSIFWGRCNLMGFRTHICTGCNPRSFHLDNFQNILARRRI